MRAVIDTNILIRALIKPQGTVGPILKRLRNGDYTIIYSEPVLDELLEKLQLPRIRDKYHLDQSVTEDLLALMALRGELVNPSQKIRVCRDPDDDRLIEAALAGQSEYIVTGDEDLLILKKFETIRMVPPHIFLASF